MHCSPGNVPASEDHQRASALPTPWPLWVLAYLTNTKSLCCICLGCQCRGRSLGEAWGVLWWEGLAWELWRAAGGGRVGSAQAVLSALAGTHSYLLSAATPMGGGQFFRACKGNRKLCLSKCALGESSLNLRRRHGRDLLSSLSARLEGIFCPMIPNRSHSKTRSVSEYPTSGRHIETLHIYHEIYTCA